MWTRSTRWNTAIANGNQAVVRCDIYPPNRSPLLDVPVADGQVRIDSTASVRRTLSLDLIDTDGTLLQLGPTSPVAPYGTEIAPYRGVRYPDGTVEMMPLGVFRVTDGDVTDNGTGSLSISASDRSRTISRNKFVDPYVIAAGQNYATAIGTLADNRLPGIDQNLAATTETTPLLVYDTEDDPWTHLEEMAKAFGHRVFFDQAGTFTLAEQVDRAAYPAVWQFAEGKNSTILTVAPSMSDDPGSNGIVMRAESTTLPAPLRTVLWDMDPASPTYSLGPYGRVPAFESSPYIASQTACDAAALAWLRKHLGGTQQIRLTAVPNPALDADDVVYLKRSSLGLDQLAIVEAVTIPLSASSAMDVTLRARQPLVDS